MHPTEETRTRSNMYTYTNLHIDDQNCCRGDIDRPDTLGCHVWNFNDRTFRHGRVLKALVSKIATITTTAESAVTNVPEEAPIVAKISMFVLQYDTPGLTRCGRNTKKIFGRGRTNCIAFRRNQRHFVSVQSKFVLRHTNFKEVLENGTYHTHDVISKSKTASLLDLLEPTPNTREKRSECLRVAE